MMIFSIMIFSIMIFSIMPLSTTVDKMQYSAQLY
jgi:hypothetical protein